METRTPKEARELAERHICLQCGAVDEDAIKGEKPKHKKGICPADYEKLRRAKAKAVDKQEILGMEAILISHGLLLPDGRSTSDPNIDALLMYRKMQVASAMQSAAQSDDEKPAEAIHGQKKATKKKAMPDVKQVPKTAKKRKQA